MTLNSFRNTLLLLALYEQLDAIKKSTLDVTKSALMKPVLQACPMVPKGFALICDVRNKR